MFALLVEKAAEGHVEAPKFSARVLTAALKVQRVQLRRKKAELQKLMGQLVESQNNVPEGHPRPYPGRY